MRSNIGMSSRMSNYQYPVKKTTWKWTPGKIGAFSLLGFMIGALIYFESSSTNSSGYSGQSNSTQGSSNTAVTSDFDKEYEKFLKQGQKIISPETLDSLRKLQATPDSEVSNKIPVEKNNNSAAEQITDNTAEPIPPKSNRSTPTKQPSAVSDNSSRSTDNGINNNPEQELTTSNNLQNNLGTLEETSAPVELPEAQLNNTQNADDPIIEEFYTAETISGTIVAASDGTPIEGVNISVNGTVNSAVSDNNGRYSIEVPGDPEHRTIQYTFKGNITERDVSPGRVVINIRF